MKRYLWLILLGIGLMIIPTVAWAVPNIYRKKAAPFLDHFNNIEVLYKLPSGMLSRVAYQESRYNPNALSRSGAIGLMQFMPATAKSFGIDPRDPFQSIEAAGKYLSQLNKQFGDWKMALAAYNFGPGNIAKYLRGEKKLPSETVAYMTSISKDIGIT